MCSWRRQWHCCGLGRSKRPGCTLPLLRPGSRAGRGSTAAAGWLLQLGAGRRGSCGWPAGVGGVMGSRDGGPSWKLQVVKLGSSASVSSASMSADEPNSLRDKSSYFSHRTHSKQSCRPHQEWHVRLCLAQRVCHRHAVSHHLHPRAGGQQRSGIKSAAQWLACRHTSPGSPSWQALPAAATWSCAATTACPTQLPATPKAAPLNRTPSHLVCKTHTAQQPASDGAGAHCHCHAQRLPAR